MADLDDLPGKSISEEDSVAEMHERLRQLRTSRRTPKSSPKAKKRAASSTKKSTKKKDDTNSAIAALSADDMATLIAQLEAKIDGE